MWASASPRGKTDSVSTSNSGGPGGEPNDCEVSGKDTDGAMSVFEFTGGGWPRHLHHDQDEWIYVVEGEFEFQVGENDKRYRLGTGESVFLPRKVAHAWGCVSGKPGKIRGYLAVSATLVMSKASTANDTRASRTSALRGRRSCVRARRPT